MLTSFLKPNLNPNCHRNSHLNDPRHRRATWLKSRVGNKPMRFKYPRVLIVGCGQVGSELIQKFPLHWNRLVLSSSPEKQATLRQLAVRVLQGNLDEASSLKRLAGLATHLIFLAPPPKEGKTDPRSHLLARVLANYASSKPHSRLQLQSLIYISTTGVYGHQPNLLLQENSKPAPQTERAYRRLDAEKTWLSWAKTAFLKRACILRVPGIYGGWRSEDALRRRFLPQEGKKEILSASPKMKMFIPITSISKIL
jgi:nucleoside-diphosphate-sugar epimerase